MNRLEQIRENFRERGYHTDEEWYEILILREGLPNHATTVQPDYIETFRGRLPDMLLRLWSEYGWGSWNQGKIWVWDPALLQPVIEAIFDGDPDYHSEDLIPFMYNAFGSIYMWRGDHRIVRFHWLDNYAIEQEYDNWNSRANVPVSEDQLIVRRLAAAIQTGRNTGIPWRDETGADMLPQAIARLGELAPGEIYGFVPALSMGGANRVENLQRLPIVEHMMFLADVQHPMLHRYHPPPEIGQGFGEIEVVRPIGRQQ